MKKINLKPFIELAEDQALRDKVHRAERATLPYKEEARISLGVSHLAAAVNQHKLVHLSVAKLYLYNLGFSDSDSRHIIWQGTAEGKFHLDNNFNIVAL